MEMMVTFPTKPSPLSSDTVEEVTFVPFTESQYKRLCIKNHDDSSNNKFLKKW